MEHHQSPPNNQDSTIPLRLSKIVGLTVLGTKLNVENQGNSEKENLPLWLVKVRIVKPAEKKIVEGRKIVSGNPYGNAAHPKGGAQLRGNETSLNTAGNLRVM